MAAYNWGGNLKPPLPVDGQVWADKDRHCWQFSSANTGWNRCPHIQLQRAYSRTIVTNGCPVGQNFLNEANWGKKPGRLQRVWDEVFTLAFVEVASATNGTVYGRRAHMTLAQFLTWCESIIPVSGSNYVGNIVINVYEAVDTGREMPYWTVWNGLYGSFRGRECYTGRMGYGRPGLPQTAGYAPNFAIAHGTNIEIPLIQHFYGKTPATSEPKACWSVRSRHGMYHLPNNTSARIEGTDTSKLAWNNTTDAWGPSVVDTYFHDTTTSNPNPVVVYRSHGGSSLTIADMMLGLRGLKGVLGDSPSGREAMVVRAMSASGSPHIKILVFKPFGVSCAAFHFPGGITSGTHDLIALGIYDAAGRRTALVNMTNYGGVEYRGAYGIRFNLSAVYQALLSWATDAAKATHDTPVLPEVVRFYLRDKTTGVRTPVSTQHLYLNRRQANLPVSVMFRHG